jgi:hypothetical protein
VTPCAEAKFLGEILTKVLKVFFLAIHSHLYTSTPSALGLIFLQTHATSYNFFSSILTLYRRKEENLIEKHTPLSYGLKNPYRNLKSENSHDYAQLNKIVRREFGFGAGSDPILSWNPSPSPPPNHAPVE